MHIYENEKQNVVIVPHKVNSLYKYIYNFILQNQLKMFVLDDKSIVESVDVCENLDVIL